ncbi:MAG: hypothetical protein KGZ81_07405 [Flavobacteriales bacterium]|nr:hypothetical protein [Flavobacteriales bacterium]
MTTAFKQVKNGSKSTLLSSIDDTVTTLEIQPGDAGNRFPTVGTFWVTIWDKETYPDPRDDPNAETVLVTSVSVDVFTIERGQVLTTPSPHTAGDAVECLLVDEQIAELQNAINTAESDIDTLESSITALAPVASSGSYNDLTDTPAPGGSPTWGEIGGTLSSQADLQSALDAKADQSSLAPIATSGAYADLTGTPTVPTSFDELADGTTNKAFTDTEKTKLAGVEAGADVTDNANVDAAGAVMNADTSTAAMSFVVDEDDMVSNSPTKIPTQQSVKNYVDTAVAGGGGGGGGMWEKILDYTFVSNTFNYDVTGLDLDADFMYRVVFHLTNPTYTNGWNLKLNNDGTTSNYKTNYTRLQSNAITGSNGAYYRLGLGIGGTMNPGDDLYVDLIITKRAGEPTRMYTVGLDNNLSTLNTASALWNSVYTPTTNITSFRLEASDWDIYAGSRIIVYKLV